MSDEIEQLKAENELLARNNGALVIHHEQQHAEITRLRAALAAARADALEEAAAYVDEEGILSLSADIRRMKASPSATDRPTGASAEKTGSDSLDSSTASTVPPTAATGHSPFDYDYTYRGVRRPR